MDPRPTGHTACIAIAVRSRCPASDAGPDHPSRRILRRCIGSAYPVHPKRRRERRLPGDRRRPPDLVYVPGFVSNIDVMWDDPDTARFLERWHRSLASSSSTSGERGCRTPCPIDRLPTLEERMDDVRAVMDGSDRTGDADGPLRRRQHVDPVRRHVPGSVRRTHPRLVLRQADLVGGLSVGSDPVGSGR
jgi:hypothetical protein